MKHFWLLLAFALPAHASPKPLALVYHGKGACKEDCALLAAKSVRQAGFRVQYVDKNNLGEGLLRKATLWVQPGGKSDEVAAALNQKQKDMIRDFVAAGGKYLGFCAGAFLIDQYVHGEKDLPGLNFWPGRQIVVPPDDDVAKIIPVQWMGKTRWLYYEGGPYFDFDPKNPAMSQYKATSFYSDGRAAGLEFPFFRGRVAVTGLHPEANASWKEKLPDPDGGDQAVVNSMIAYLMAH